jgi:hypothetical protein
MLVIWDAEDGSEKQTWHFDPDDVPKRRAIEIERLYTNGGYDQWVAALQAGEFEARSILLWYMLTQVHPKLQYKDLPDFRVRQLKTEMTVEELRKLWKRILRMKLAPDKMADLEIAFETSLEDAAEREGLDLQFEFVEGQLAIEGDLVAAAATDDPDPKAR